MSAGPSAPEKAPQGLRRPRSRAKRIAAHLAVFGCGMILGGVVAGYYSHRMILKTLSNLDLMADRLTRRLDRELDLDERQAQEVSAILHRHAKTVSGIFAEIHPLLSADFDLMHEEVGAVLTPEQKEKWDKRCERMKKRLHPPTAGP